MEPNLRKNKCFFFASSAQDVLKRPEMHILSNCSYHLHQLGTYKTISTTKGWYSNLCCHLDESYLFSSPAEVSSPFTVYLLGDHWAHNRSWDSNIRTPGQNEWIVLWFGWVHIEYFEGFAGWTENCVQYVSCWLNFGWVVSNGSWLVEEINQLFVTHASWKWPTSSITFTGGLARKEGIPIGKPWFGPALDWISSKVLIAAVLPFNSQEMSSCYLWSRESRVSFQFFHFLILRELIIHCGWRSKIANDSGSVAHCR